MGWKLLEGKGYCTFEWNAMDEAIQNIDIENLKESFKSIPANKKVTVVVPSENPEFSYPGVLEDLELRKVKEREVYFKDLRETTAFPVNSLKFIADPPMEESLRCLRLILDNHDEAIRQLDALNAEVEPEKFRVYLVRKNGEDAGICIPHIEPFTESEGRLFFFGITPEFRGKGLSSTVHKFAIASLRIELKADSYIGVTDRDNQPMKKVFVKNGCQKIQSLEIYSRIV
ncbi:GNAT family N-acetyltransferase [Bacillus sp. SG-1]|uniref:GNAT family N-acetyltransferase n=1 Tax=Bacillus sp. SG-1 TaxID=161544 RepID=UPI0001544992|nr:GNAT family N-acetyltransferase [Bacillus sp. SG-1]EDL64301.1 acetyltransferase, GNAT family protein [Bacillus sp. SG-1]